MCEIKPILSREDIETATREELMAYLENVRCIACYDDEPTELLRECALEDWED